MAQPSTFGSNNPFRRRATPSNAAPPPPPPTAPSAYSASSSSLSDDTVTTFPSSNLFRSQLQALPQSVQPPPLTSFQKPKVVKKVRVQSPPPSSPESAGVPDHYSYSPAARDDDASSNSISADDDDDDDDYRRSPFDIAAPASFADSKDSEDIDDVGEEVLQRASQRPPPNPFQRTLSDLSAGSRDSGQSAAGTKGSLDVDAFRRLLLTGESSGGSGALAQPLPAVNRSPSSAQQGVGSARPTTPAGDGASTTDTSSISRQSIFDAAPPVQETPRTSHEISEPEADADQHGLISSPQLKTQPAPTTLRKKPPPPSSRHGKLIKTESRGKEQSSAPAEGPVRPGSSSSQTGRGMLASPPSSPSRQRPSTPSDVNKPLPPAPARFSSDEAVPSIFDREAAGKVPELDAGLESRKLSPPARPPTPPNASHAISSLSPAAPSQPARKPAPPPRRQPHGRADSKHSVAITTPASPAPLSSPQPEENEPQRRSSQESTRSRSSSLRVSIHAPAPPPPRRPNHGSRPSTSFTSPSAFSFSSIASSGSERSPSEAAEMSLSPSPVIISAAAETASPGPIGADTTAPGPQQQAHNPLLSKLSPPPPPPARNPSIRAKRPPSRGTSSSLDPSITPRRLGSREKEPPPPPPRQRGSSKGSMDGGSAGTITPGGGGGRRTSTDSAQQQQQQRILTETLAEEPGPEEEGGERGVTQDSSANDILAELDALRREVDALRGGQQHQKVG
ncbi:hypothetical protein QBC46DRAFT_380956 [Diplogelasinospora grovesii]|uniref:Uncharacterized protein n=1 Tax=Diplogelasinospora grovesii TaxID=303347 RepID=A0AAN6NAT4_9PEZI|nr:hypothetical protein QBC46DRAFT_380956 [Diplogelasinospora grovesii]